MKRLNISSILITSGLATSVMANTPYTYNALQTDTPPVIDGVLDDASWHNAKATSLFVLHNNGQYIALSDTWAKVTYDADNLYIAYWAQDRHLSTSYQNHDDPTYQNDDTVEVFLDPDGDGKNYYELGISLNTAYDVVIHQPSPWSDDLAWNIEGLEHAVTVQGTVNDDSDVDEGYHVEVKIPLKSLNYLGNEEYQHKQWRFNLFRANYKSYAPDWEAYAWLSWSPVGSFGFHQPDTFAFLNFSDVPQWQAKAYQAGEQVAYQGNIYQAEHYSTTAAPGESTLDNWRILSDIPTSYNANLYYLAGDQVSVDDVIYQANWKTKGQHPAYSVDWTRLP